MRPVIFTLITLAATASAFAAGAPNFDWDAWRCLPVQEGGRYKPFDTLAWESARWLCGRTYAADPETGERLDYMALYLTLLFQQDAPSGPSPHAMPPEPDSQPRPADKWDRAPLFPVTNQELRKALGLPQDRKHLSYDELSRAKLHDSRTNYDIPFLAAAQELFDQKRQRKSSSEHKLLELADAYLMYQELRSGKTLKFIPLTGSIEDRWLSAAELLRTEFNDSNDPSGLIRKAQTHFRKAKQALQANDPAAFNAASSALLAVVKDIGLQSKAYPAQSVINLEVSYNRWAPFRFAWILTASAFVFSILALALKWKLFLRLAIAACLAGLLAILVGFGMRVAISGFAPVTNMYESVVYVGLGTVIFGLIFEWMYHKTYILAASAAITTAALILADSCPAVLDSSIRPLLPVLRDNFWLVVHVIVIMQSYAAFALAWGIGNVALGYYLLGSQNHETIAVLNRFTYRVLQVGVLLLMLGTILGAVWAEYAWGRFWGWDPKEVWALITLLGYLALLHARYVGWVGRLGLAAFSVLCFALVLMAWYGVNYLLGTGLHSYGFGGGGQEYVFAALALQFLYVGAAVVRATQSRYSEPA
jgi:cytochrome c-type biogenesis protein CcsB